MSHVTRITDQSKVNRMSSVNQLPAITLQFILIYFLEDIKYLKSLSLSISTFPTATLIPITFNLGPSVIHSNFCSRYTLVAPETIFLSSTWNIPDYSRPNMQQLWTPLSNFHHGISYLFQSPQNLIQITHHSPLSGLVRIPSISSPIEISIVFFFVSVSPFLLCFSFPFQGTLKSMTAIKRVS